MRTLLILFIFLLAAPAYSNNNKITIEYDQVLIFKIDDALFSVNSLKMSLTYSGKEEGRKNKLILIKNNKTVYTIEDIKKERGRGPDDEHYVSDSHVFRINGKDYILE